MLHNNSPHHCYYFVTEKKRHPDYLGWSWCVMIMYPHSMHCIAYHDMMTMTWVCMSIIIILFSKIMLFFLLSLLVCFTCVRILYSPAVCVTAAYSDSPTKLKQYSWHQGNKRFIMSLYSFYARIFFFGKGPSHPEKKILVLLCRSSVQRRLLQNDEGHTHIKILNVYEKTILKPIFDDNVVDKQ